MLRRLRASPLWPAPCVVLIAASPAICAPLLRPGYVLTYDMVFAPRMPVNAGSLGLGSSLPRAVPSDLVVALASHVVAGQVVQKAVLLLRAHRRRSRGREPGRARALGRSAAAALAYLWTPYMAERLLLGQWAVLVGYAMLPWVVRRGRTGPPEAGPGAVWSRRVGTREPRGCSRLAYGAMVLPVVIVWRGPRSGRAARALGLLGALAVFALPWPVPSLLRPGGVGADLLGSRLSPRSRHAARRRSRACSPAAASGAPTRCLTGRAT